MRKLRVICVVLLAFLPVTAAAASPVPPRIISPEGNFYVPWQALVLPAGGLCGGTVRDAMHIVTAAHCVNQIDPRDIAVGTGLSDRANPDATLQVRDVQGITSSVDFTDAASGFDVALLTLDQPLNLSADVDSDGSADVQALPLAPVGSTFIGATGFISGWGTTIPGDNSSVSYVLQGARLLVQPDSACSNYGQSFDPTTMLCATYTNPMGHVVDTCLGDSGGPLAVIPPSGPIGPLAGITSFGFGCADPSFPGIYAKVAAAPIHEVAANPAPVFRPVPTGRPVITGTPQVGVPSQCSPGSWSGDDIKLFAEWVRIDGQSLTLVGNAFTYSPTTDDVGHQLLCAVFALNNGGSRIVISDNSAAVLPAPTPTPTNPNPPSAPATGTPTGTSGSASGASRVPAYTGPTVSFMRRSCTRSACRLTILVNDGGRGVRRVEVSARRAQGCTTRKQLRRARCAKRSLTARKLSSTVFEVRHRLPAGTWRFTVRAVDRFGVATHRAVQFTLRVPRS